MRLAFSRSYVVLVRTQRCARMSRIERENASKRSRAIATFGSITRSKTRCRSYNASSLPTNGIGPHPYCSRRSEALLVLVFVGTSFGESRGTVLFVLIEHPCRRNYLISVSSKSTAQSASSRNEVASRGNVMIVIPKPDHGLRKIVFVPDRAQARRA